MSAIRYDFSLFNDNLRKYLAQACDSAVMQLDYGVSVEALAQMLPHVDPTAEQLTPVIKNSDQFPAQFIATPDGIKVIYSDDFTAGGRRPVIQGYDIFCDICCRAYDTRGDFHDCVGPLYPRLAPLVSISLNGDRIVRLREFDELSVVIDAASPVVAPLEINFPKLQNAVRELVAERMHLSDIVVIPKQDYSGDADSLVDVLVEMLRGSSEADRDRLLESLNNHTPALLAPFKCPSFIYATLTRFCVHCASSFQAAPRFDVLHPPS